MNAIPSMPIFKGLEIITLEYINPGRSGIAMGWK
jgi:hypothetical protein